MEKNTMSTLNDFFDEAGLFLLATEAGKQAKVRPLRAHVKLDGKVYSTLGDFKAVYRQMKENPNVEIAAFIAKNMKWLSYTGKAVFEENKTAEEKIFESLPHLRKAYNPETGHKMMIFSLTDATAKIVDMAGNEEVLF